MNTYNCETIFDLQEQWFHCKILNEFSLTYKIKITVEKVRRGTWASVFTQNVVVNERNLSSSAVRKVQTRRNLYRYSSFKSSVVKNLP